MKYTQGNPVSAEFSSGQALSSFSQFFSDKGLSIFDYTKINPHIRTLYEVPQRSGYLLLQAFCLKTNLQDNLDCCVIDYVDNNQIQAYAASQHGLHYVGISHCLPILFQTLFQYLMRNGNPFSMNEPDELVADYAFSLSLPTADTEQERIQTIEQLIADTMPRERWQKIMATKLAEIAVLFCFSHEISHITYGHSELSSKRGSIGIWEISLTKNTQSKRISNRLRQAWEIQADRAALALLHAYVNNHKEYKTRLLNTLKCDKKKNPTLQLMARVAYAVSFVFFLFGQEAHSISSTTSHPSIIIRRLFALECIISYTLREVGHCCSEKEVTDAILEAANKAEKAWHRLGFTFNGDVLYKNELSSVVDQLFRNDELSKQYLGHYQWAANLR